MKQATANPAVSFRRANRYCGYLKGEMVDSHSIAPICEREPDLYCREATSKGQRLAPFPTNIKSHLET